jgi:hypothetical protein
MIRTDVPILVSWPSSGRSGQWPFQEPKLEVPTIFQGLCKGISQQNMAL